MEKEKSYKIKCFTCGKTFQNRQKHTKFCSDKCRKEDFMIRTGRFAQTDLSSNIVGAISEYVVASELMSLGYEVFKAMATNAFCDLIACSPEKNYRIEVKTGYVSTTGKVTFPKSDKKIDVYGVYIRAPREIRFFNTSLNEIKMEPMVDKKRFAK